MKRVFWTVLPAVLAVFAGCEKSDMDLNGIQVENEGYPFEITAHTAAVKTANDGLNTNWAEGDKIAVFHTNAGSGFAGTGDRFSIDGADVAEGRFKGTLAQAPVEELSYDWYAVYPFIEGKFQTVPESQTQVGYGSTAHLSGIGLPLAGRALNVNWDQTPSVTMEQLCAVIKLVVTNNSLYPLTISNASVTSGRVNLTGAFSVEFSGSETSLLDANDANTLNDKYMSRTVSLLVQDGTAIPVGETATLYFAIRPFVANDETLTLSVNGYEKSLVIPAKDVRFDAGKIKTVSFNYDRKTPCVSGGYRRITTMDEMSDGNYLILGMPFDDNFGLLMYGTPATTGNSAVLGTLPFTSVYTSAPSIITNPDANAVWTLDYGVENHDVTLFSAAGNNYLLQENGGTLSVTTANKAYYKVSVNDAFFNLLYMGYYLSVSTGGDRWRGYSEGYKNLLLYKYIAGLSSISLGGTYKTEFEAGEAFDCSGLVVTAHYDDETQKTVTPTSVSVPDLATAGQKEVTVTYIEEGNTRTASYNINVIPAKTWVLDRIAVASDPDKVYYMSGDRFDPTGMVIKAYYVNQANNTEEKEDIVTKFCTLTPSTDVALTGKNHSIKISYTEGGTTKTTTVPITVTASFEVDFESDLSSYTGLTFTNIVSGQNSLAAHSGSYHGSVYVSGATAGQNVTGTIRTEQKLPSPKSAKFYCATAANETSNENDFWYIQVSEDGINWTDLSQQNATYVGPYWMIVSADLSSYHNVYVQVIYSGSYSERYIDDLEIVF